MTPSEQPRMTASERLERLDSQALHATNVQRADSRMYALATLRNALPELIAVVKAAEQIASMPSGRQKAATIEGWVEADAVMRTLAHNALTALERKLGEPE